MKVLKLLLLLFIQLVVFAVLLLIGILLFFNKRYIPGPQPSNSTTSTVSSTTTSPAMFTTQKRPFEICVWIYTVDDNLIREKVNLKETDTIRRIKEAIEEKQNIPRSSMNLNLLGTELEDDKTLLFYNIHKGSIVDLFVY